MENKNIIIISDSTGDTADQVVHASVTQFKDYENLNINRFFNITSEKEIDKIIDSLSGENLIFTTIVKKDVMDYLLKKAAEKNYDVVDIMKIPMDKTAEFLGQEPIRESGLSRSLTENYFSSIEALEFAVKYDDGKDPRGILEADVVLIGVSRTSKTPLSLNLATTKGYKVCNIPLVPEIEVPNQLFEVDKNKVIGLIIDPKKLNEIREQRLRELGITELGEYCEDKRINQELDYAIKIMKDIGCEIIDVSNKTIVETSILVANKIESKKYIRPEK